ncbi:HAMP domain-containing histidine kinase [Luteolibacter flavescens]|uniref:histidine kinase n=1 Tax=Luteolibacter flavescens TaxID=1859460 RepID=A0ABT3FPQ2_9BACT|nr:HAMP domain-containing sensor histidine kinase [Luteolibacter flavescens]MCW1885427.1 HAMP domain-containing histidine kinase [Luteolibacter flavescens]
MSLKRKDCLLVHGLVAVCAVALLGAMAAITRGTISAERERALAESRAIEQENIRLALWRMDAAATAWIADEAQRPVISPPSKEPPKQEIRLRFEAREDGSLVLDRPEVSAELRSVLGLGTSDSEIFPSVCNAMPDLPMSWSAPPPSPAPPQEGKAIAQQQQQQRATSAYQVEANRKELATRGQAVKGALDVSQAKYEDQVFLQNAVPHSTWNVAPDWALARNGLPRPAWVSGELFLLRHLQWKTTDGSLLRAIQGTWIDAALLQQALLARIGDLFPNARLTRAASPDDSSGMMLASFPLRFEAGTDAMALAPEIPRAIWLPLAAGWITAILAIAATWLLVGGLFRLSEKRASFVSAVTHELRTPLTTFQLYSEMLESGAVKEEKRGAYFRTLRREAERLSHLVENVLAFSRIERGSARATTVELGAGDLVRPMIERLAERLLETGLSLKADLDAPAWQAIVRTDVTAVEHVLFNLIDNAAKYAAGSTPPELHLEAVLKGRSLELQVRDHGPGIPAREHRRVFRAFHKSAAAAAESRPGVGLGLSLSRRLARTAGGDLLLAKSEKGACFVLVLPLAAR